MGLCDQAAAAQCSAVKAASTAAVATDPAVVVAVSPNNTVAVTESGTWNITNISGTISLPTGAATSALQTTGNSTLTTINTTLGSPFQAGGSIGNTTFGATLNATPSLANGNGVVPTIGGAVYSATNGAYFNILQGNAVNASGNPIFAQITAGSAAIGTVTANAGTNLNTSTLSTSANQTNASQKTQIVDGSGNVIGSTSNNLDVQCANCSGSGVSTADAATFTAGTSLFAGSGGQFTSGGATACVTGHQCEVGITAARAFLTDLSSQNGTALGTPVAWGSTPSGNVISANVNCITGCAGSGGTSATDAATFTAGTSTFTPTGGQYTSGGATACVTGHECTVGMGADRTLFAQLPHAEVAVAGATAPADALVGGMMYNSGGVTPSSGQALALQSDANGNLKVVGTGIAIGSTTSGQTGSLVFGATTTSNPSYTTAQSNPLSLDTNGGVRIAGEGSAGTATGGVVTVQGVASMTPVLVNPGTASNFGVQTQGSTTSGQSGVLLQAAVTTSAPSYTTAQTSPLSLDTSGNLRVNVAAGSSGNAAASATGSAVPADASYDGINVGGTLRGQTGVNPTGTVYAAQMDLASLDGTSLGAPSNYGTSPGAVAVQGVNSFVTNTPSVSGGTIASTTMQNAAVANGNGTVLTTTNYNTALVNVNCSVACSGGTTVNFEGTDSTGTFFSVAAYPIGGGASVTTATTTGQFLVPVAALTSLRARISAYSAGTITVTGTPFYGFPAAANTVAISGTPASNITQVSGTTVSTGNGTSGAGNLRVNIASDNTAFAVNATLQASSATAIGTVNPTTAANWGIGATAASIPANAISAGCNGLSAEQAAVTTGQLTTLACGLDGKLINLPYANKENAVRGAGSSTTTAAITLLAASGSGSLKEYLVAMQCANTSATSITVALNDTATSTFIVPTGSGTNITFPIPLVAAANTALTATPSAGETTIYCNGQGYNGA